MQKDLSYVEVFRYEYWILRKDRKGGEKKIRRFNINTRYFLCRLGKEALVEKQEQKHGGLSHGFSS